MTSYLWSGRDETKTAAFAAQLHKLSVMRDERDRIAAGLTRLDERIEDERRRFAALVLTD